MSRYAARRDNLRRTFRKAGVDALLVTNFTNVTYLTGFTGDDSYLLVLAKATTWSSAIRATRPSWRKSARAWKPTIRPPGVGMLEAVAAGRQAAKRQQAGHRRPAR